jgi:two-component system response regulator HydG
LINGESGTGKELVARAIHSNSGRKDRPFVAINCAAIVDTLLESELFGHEKGAFTGAVGQKKGKLETAEGGTVFLDEIGELAAPLQAKLLRVLQEREFERVGGTRPIKLDIRLVAATNVDLNEASRTGKFRQDLYYRLNVVSIEVPPLRDRAEDIPLLAAYFTARYSEKINRRVAGISPKARACLQRYPWPGNVRELENAVAHGCAFSTCGIVALGDLPTQLKQEGLAALRSNSTHGRDADKPSEKVHVTPIAELERQAILDAIRLLNGDKLEAAKLLGIGKTTLYRKLKEYGIGDPVHV